MPIVGGRIAEVRNRSGFIEIGTARARAGRIEVRSSRSSGWIDFGETPTFAPVPSGGHLELYLIGTDLTVRTNETVWVGPGGVRDSRTKAEGALAAGTLKALHMHATAQPGAGQYRYTIFKNGDATANTFTLTGATQTGNSKVAVEWAEDALFALKIENIGAPECDHGGSMVFDPDEED